MAVHSKSLGSSDQTPILQLQPAIEKRSVQQIHQLAQQIIVQNIMDIAHDYKYRMDHYSQNKKMLDEGVFYPRAYLTALEKTGQAAQLKGLIECNAGWEKHLPVSHFTKTPKNLSEKTESAVNSSRYVVKSGIAPHAALDAARNGPSLIGCTDVCIIALYEALKVIWGIEKFDAMFSAESSTPLKVIMDEDSNPVKNFLKRTEIAHQGDIVVFRNAKGYLTRHPLGYSLNYNTICCNENPPKFTTLGLNPDGLTEFEVNQQLLSDFNENPEPYPTKYLLPEVARFFLRTLQAPQIEFMKRFHEDPSFGRLSISGFALLGGGAKYIYSIDPEAIAKIANASISNARLIFNKMHETTKSHIR
jgi:hypothetical protein